jgi:ClpP class serine protease
MRLISCSKILSTDAAGLDIEQVATGEHWYGVQALEKGWWTGGNQR